MTYEHYAIIDGREAKINKIEVEGIETFDAIGPNFVEKDFIARVTIIEGDLSGQIVKVQATQIIIKVIKDKNAAK